MDNKNIVMIEAGLKTGRHPADRSLPEEGEEMTGIMRATRSRALILGLLFCALSVLGPGVRGATAADLPIYADALSAGWGNWSWGATVDLTATSPVHGGSKSIAVTFTSGWSALYLLAVQPIDLSNYDRLRFWIHGGSTGTRHLRIVANTNGAATVPVTATANTWTQVEVALSDLGDPATLSDLFWQDTTNGAQPVFYLDDISLVAIIVTPPPTVVGPALSLDAASGQHAISADIYGMSFADEQLAAELRLPVRRRGGNSTSRYNWQNDTYNTGSDWFYENIPENNPNPLVLPDGSAADRFVEQDRRTGARSIMTIPLIGWVAKQRKESHPHDCGFKVSVYGPQDWVDPWDTDCGNGLHNGANIAGNSPGDTSVAITSGFVSDWISHLIRRYGTASNGGVAFYNLDNEPMLWNSTHRDVHPQPTSYDELRDRTWQYAPAIKAADPTAKTLGPVSWGWCAYFYSAKDGCSIGADYQAHGNTPFVPWYLQQMHTYEQQHNLRILDYLDLHYYPQGNGIFSGAAGSATTKALRLRSTRALWDANYTDESWINDKVYLIPRMREWVSANYPETKLAITEYSWGALESINGALAQADVLGIFGREGLDLATLWGPPTSTQPGAHAFRIFRNYDGAGHGFGETGIQAASSDQDSLAVYASRRTSDSALTVVVINKVAKNLISSISLAGITPTPTAAVYRYSSANLAAIEHLADQTVSGSGFSATFPADSITLLVIAPQGSSPETQVADFSVAPSSGPAPLFVHFTDASVPGPTSWLWDFGDGAGSSLQNPTHGYQKAGSYAVALTATGTGGAATTTKSNYVTVASCPNLPVKIKETATYYPTIQEAVALGTDATVQIQGLEYAENVVVENNARVILQGGYDCFYATHPMFATIHGSLTVGAGTVVIANMAIK